MWYRTVVEPMAVRAYEGRSRWQAEEAAARALANAASERLCVARVQRACRHHRWETVWTRYSRRGAPVDVGAPNVLSGE